MTWAIVSLFALLGLMLAWRLLLDVLDRRRPLPPPQNVVEFTSRRKAR
jgi:ABC-type nitrate/sulfonate/bicarbonate transport system permease component